MLRGWVNRVKVVSVERMGGQGVLLGCDDRCVTRRGVERCVTRV